MCGVNFGVGVQYTYEMRTTTRTVFGGPAEFRSARDGDIAGLPSTPLYGRWQPASIGAITGLSVANPDTTFYLPDPCGFYRMDAGVLTNGISGELPSLPVMTAPR